MRVYIHKKAGLGLPIKGATVPMCLAGGAAYEKWLAESDEQAKPNRVGNLVSAVYRAMEEERHLWLQRDHTPEK